MSEKKRRVYRRQAKSYLLDRTRQYFVQETPEEHVRQAMLDHLIDELKIPSQLVRSEFNQSKRNASGRADIVVWAPNSDDHQGDAVLVVECKRPGTLLGDDVFHQGRRYAETLSAEYLLLSSGDCHRVYHQENENWLEVEELPSWDEMLGAPNFGYLEPVHFARPAWSRINTVARARKTAMDADQEGYLGEDSPGWLAPIVLDLGGMMADDEEGPTCPCKHMELTLKEDLGRTERFFGNAAGGNWALDWYRSFVVRRSGSLDDIVVSLAVASNEKTVNHPVWGNSRGRSLLLVAIDADKSSHLSLQMDLEKTIDEDELEAGLVTIRHKGRLTAGKRGRLKDAMVVDFVREHAPDLVKDDLSILGHLDLSKRLEWEETLPFLLNIIRYALIRDDLRERVRRGLNHG